MIAAMQQLCREAKLVFIMALGGSERCDLQATQPEDHANGDLSLLGHLQSGNYRQGQAQDKEVKGDAGSHLGETQCR